MSSYKRFVIFFSIFIFINFAEASKIDIDKNFDENLYILYALDYERNNNLLEAKKIYEKLFINSLNYDYFVKYLRLSLSTNSFEDIVNKVPVYIKDDLKDHELILRIYAVSLLNLNKTEKAMQIANELVTKYKTSLNYEVLANVYFVKKDFKKAVGYFEYSYNIDNNPNTLLNLVNILYAYLNKKNEALAYLETHIRLFGCDSVVCSKLISIYQEQDNIDGVISVLKRSYNSFKDDENQAMAAKTYKLLVAYLEKKDIDEAIKFLEKNRIDDIKLASLYKRTNQNNKALKLMKKLYKEDGNIDFLAQIAILEFEGAKDKKRVLKSVIKKFEDVLVVLDSHVYQNYLGYLMIDYDIDVKKGLALVEKALEKAPNNVAYIDSKAWAYYKLKKCDLAYSYMKKVVDEVGLNDEEIKIHWKKIKECSKK